MLPKTSILEFIKVQSKKLDYYMKSNKAVSGLLFNSSASDASVTEISNSALDPYVRFWTDDEDYDDENPGTGFYYMLIYSPENLRNSSQINFVNGSSGSVGRQGALDSSLERLLQESTSSETSLFFSKYEMDENYNAKKGLPWWAYLLIILAVLLLLLLLIFLICCCCCCCCAGKDENDNQQTGNREVHYHTTYVQGSTTKKSTHTSLPNNRPNEPTPRDVEVKSYSAYNQSYFEDGFTAPVMRRKDDSKVNNYINEHDFEKKAF